MNQLAFSGTTWSRVTKIIVAIILLAALYRAANWSDVAATLRSLDTTWLAAALLLFVPQTILSAWRWRWLVEPVCAISLRESVRQTLAASALNLVAPSKLGDLSKAAMLPTRGNSRKGKACGLVAIEKAADVATLASLLLVGCWGGEIASAGSAAAMILIPIALAIAWQTRMSLIARGVLLALVSVALWILHLAQIDCFLRAAGVTVPWTVSFARIPIAIFAGLLPVSFCGLGTRDAALVWLFADVAPAGTMAGVGALTALRYLVPGVLGVPLLRWPASQAKDAEPVAAVDDCELV